MRTIAALLLFTVAGGATAQIIGPGSVFRPETIRAHMTFLSDDSLEGRGTGTRGFEIAARYAASQFDSYGLEPAGVDGTFYQRVRFQQNTPIAEESSLVIGERPGRETTFQWGRDFVALGNTERSRLEVSAPIVFVGYGISAPEYGHHDYAADVRGAIVAFVPGVPEHLPMARRDYYMSQKWRLAQQHGAIATIELSTPEEDKRWTWADRVLSSTEGRGTALEGDGSLRRDEQLPRVLISTDATTRLFGYANLPLSKALAAKLPLRLPMARFTFTTRRQDLSSPHVIATLPGSDPRLRNEYVAFVAHLDGQGRGRDLNGDDIYNSAIDNALGSALLLSLAEAFGRMDQRPTRSILFIASTGEELGIAGMPYFVDHPTVPIESIVAAINIDGPAFLTEPVRAILAMGAANSTLSATVGRASAQLGLKVNEADAPLNYSDHYPFVMKGIPSLWIVLDGGGAAASEASVAVARTIHKPNDDMNRAFNWDTAVTFARLNFLIGQETANQAERPRWNTGDILGEKFGR